MRLDELRLAVHPGAGLVGRFEHTVLLVVGDATSPVAAALVEACRNHESAAERLRSIGTQRKPTDPAFFALVAGDAAVVSFIAGMLKVSIDAEGSRMELALTDRGGWMEETLRGRLRAVAVAERSVRIGSQPLSDLIEGVVMGGGIELVDRSTSAALSKTSTRPPAERVARPTERSASDPVAPPEGAAHEAPAERPVDVAIGAVPAGAREEEPQRPISPDDTVKIPLDRSSFVPVEAAQPPAESEPTTVEHEPSPTTAQAPAELPGFEQQATMAGFAARPAASEVVIVAGRECAAHHLNDPLAPACRTCGAELSDSITEGPRPPLGRFVSKQGLSFPIERDMIVGRHPETAAEVQSGSHIPLAAPETEAVVSRIHAEIHISQWTVLLTDRNSANGTFVRPADVAEWIRLEPGHTVQIAPGSAIMLGGYQLDFEA